MLPDEKPADVLQAIVRATADPLVEVAMIDPRPTPSPPSLMTPEVQAAIQGAATATWGQVAVIPFMEMGATDGLYLRNAGMPVYGVTGIAYDPEDVRAHGRDERILVRSYYEGIDFIERLARTIGGAPPW
jgi:acetylornithine deacetylase/succinyl-diaminopimelate desuccinylase-like protein